MYRGNRIQFLYSIKANRKDIFTIIYIRVTVCCYTPYVLQIFDVSCRHAAPQYTLSQLPHLYRAICYLYPPCLINFRRLTRDVSRFPCTLEFGTKCPGSHWLKILKFTITQQVPKVKMLNTQTPLVSFFCNVVPMS